jgi:hypothetical protein
MEDLTEQKQASLERFLELIRHPGSEYGYPWGSRLVFSESGKARLAHYAGMIFALKHFGGQGTLLEQLARTSKEIGTPLDMAAHLAHELDRQLTYLASYGGSTEFPQDEGRASVAVPGFKVALHDDGDYGFSIMWYKPITTKRVREKAEELQAKWKASGEHDELLKFSDDSSSALWDMAMKQAALDLRIRKDLEEWRCYDTEYRKARMAEYEAAHKEHTEEVEQGHSFRTCGKCDVPSYYLQMERAWFQYGFSHNGGLILHGLHRDEDPRWSIHT